MDDSGHREMRGLWRRYRSRIALVSAALALALLFARSWRIDYPYSIDFQVYWLAGKRLATGQKGDLYAPGGGPAQGTPIEMPQNEFKNLPVVAIAFVPFASFDYGSAKRIFWLVNLLALAVSAYLIGRYLLPERFGGVATRIAWAMAGLSVFAPLHIALRHGQTTPLVLWALVSHLVATVHGHRYASGVFLALAGLIKIPLLLLTALVAWNREWKSLAAWAMAITVTGIVSLVLFGADLHRQYLDGLTVHAGSVITGHNNQSVAAVVTRLMDPVPTFDWEPRPMPHEAFWMMVLVSAAILGILLWGLARRGGPRGAPNRYVLDSGAVLASAIVVLPVAWDHYFLLLVPGWILLTTEAIGTRSSKRPTLLVLVGATALAWALPTPQRVMNDAPELGLPAAILISHYFFGAVLMLVAIVIDSGDARDRNDARLVP